MKAEIGVILLQAKGPQRLSAKPQKSGEPDRTCLGLRRNQSCPHLTSDSRPPDRENDSAVQAVQAVVFCRAAQAPDHSCPLWTAHGQHLPPSTENLTPAWLLDPPGPGDLP